MCQCHSKSPPGMIFSPGVSGLKILSPLPPSPLTLVYLFGFVAVCHCKPMWLGRISVCAFNTIIGKYV